MRFTVITLALALFISAPVSAAEKRCGRTVADTVIYGQKELTVSDGFSEAKIPLFSIPVLDAAVESAAAEAMSQIGGKVSVSADVFTFGRRIVSVLLEIRSQRGTFYRGVVFDRECSRLLSLSDILAEGVGDEDVDALVDEFARSHPAFASEDFERLGKNRDFILTEHGAGLCAAAESGGFVCVIPFARRGIFCGALERGTDVFPWDKAIAFTFDDGPSEYTDAILDFLEKHGARATFFILGCHVEGNEDAIRRMKSLGCELGCHGYSHSDMRAQSAAKIADEISRTSDLIKDACGTAPTVFRAPYGEFPKATESLGLHRIKWSVDTLDWRTQNAEAVKNSILSRAESGDIVLLHDIFGSSAEGFKLAAQELLKRGYRLVTVSELLGLDGMSPDETVYHRKE